MALDELKEDLEYQLQKAVARAGALAAITFVMLPLPQNRFHLLVVEAGAAEADVDRLSNHIADKLAKAKALT